MANFKIDKVIASLPPSLAPDTMYAVRVGTGFDLYITDNTGAIAHKINAGMAQEVYVQETRPATTGSPWIWWETDASGLILDCVVNNGV